MEGWSPDGLRSPTLSRTRYEYNMDIKEQDMGKETSVI